MPEWWQRIIEQQRASRQMLPPVPFAPTAPLQRRFIPATMAPQDTSQGQIMTGAPGYGTPGGTDSILSPPVGPPPPSPDMLPGLGGRGPVSPMAEQMGVTGPDAALPGAPTPQAPGIDLDRLMQVMQTMGQPLIPSNAPLLQAGAILSGFAAGMKGQENPVLKQLLAERELQTNRAIQLGTLGLHLQSAAQAKFEKEREFQTKRDDEAYRRAETSAKMGSEIVFKSGADVSPTMKAFGAKTLVSGMRGMGFPITEEEEAAVTTSPLTKATMHDIAVNLMAGFLPTDVAAWKQVPIGQVTVIQKALEKDEYRTALDLPKLSDIKKTADEQKLRDLDIATKQMGLADPKLGEAARLLSFKKYQKRIEDLDDAQRKQVAIEALSVNLQDAMARGGIPPVGEQAARSIITGERVIDSLETLKSLLKGGTVDQYIGPFTTLAPLREWWARNAPPGWADRVPDELSLFGVAEAQMQGEIRRLQSGQAVTTQEGAWLLAQVPARSKDKKEVYAVKLDYVLKAIKQANEREKVFAGVGGRAALNASYRAHVFLLHPIDAPPESTQPPQLAPGSRYFYKPGTNRGAVVPLGATPPEGFIEAK